LSRNLKTIQAPNQKSNPNQQEKPRRKLVNNNKTTKLSFQKQEVFLEKEKPDKNTISA